MARLPTPGGDDRIWGDVLNKFLRVSHKENGELKNTEIISSKANINDVVNVNEKQRIRGAKTFESPPVAKEGLVLQSPDGNLWLANVNDEGLLITKPAVLDAASINEAALLLGQRISSTSPIVGGQVIINNIELGSFDYRITNGSIIIDDFNASEWFTMVEDTASAWIIVKGDLTINSGQIFKPNVRKLFTVIYVTGDILVNGEISMSKLGANHSGIGTSGGLISSGELLIAEGTYSGVVNPAVPATGGSGAAGVKGGVAKPGLVGEIGINGATGGGGSGAKSSPGSETGSGASGTAFSGGAGSGAKVGSGSTEDGESNGGKGSDGIGAQSGGGAGNPGGNGAHVKANPKGEDGTGGVLVIIVEGSYNGSGEITAAGANGGSPPAGRGGGGSGGGSVTILVGDSDNGPIPTALGGAGGLSDGGAGGNGSARKLSLK